MGWYSTRGIKIDFKTSKRSPHHKAKKRSYEHKKNAVRAEQSEREPVHCTEGMYIYVGKEREEDILFPPLIMSPGRAC